MSTSPAAPKRQLEIENQGTKKAARVEGEVPVIDKLDSMEQVNYQLTYTGVGNMYEFVDGVRTAHRGEAAFYLPGYNSDVPKLIKQPVGIQIVAKTSGTSVLMTLSENFTMVEGNIKVTKEFLISGGPVVLWKFHVKVQKRQELTLQFE